MINLPLSLGSSAGTTLSAGNTAMANGLAMISDTKIAKLTWGTAETSTVHDFLDMIHDTSGTAAAGFGIGTIYHMENDGGVSVLAARESVSWVDAASGSEDASYALSLMTAGTLTASLSVAGATGLSVTASDAATVTTTDALTITHLTSGTAGILYGCGILLRGEDASGGLDDMGRVEVVWSDAASASEDSVWKFHGRVAGAMTLFSTFHLLSSFPSITVPAGGSFRVGTEATAQLRISASTSTGRADYEVSSNTFSHNWFINTAATSGARQGFAFTPISNTNQTLNTEISTWNVVGGITRQWATSAAMVTQRENRWAAPTYGFVGASTMPLLMSHDFGGAPIAGTNATFTTHFAGRIGADVAAGPSTATYNYSTFNVPAHTVTVTGATGSTATCSISGLSLGIITITDASAATYTRAATLYIAGSPLAAGSITLSNTYALWVDTGSVRFDGNIGFFSTEPVAQQDTGIVVTNNITAGGTDDTFANYTDLTTYATDAAAIRNNLHQAARKIKLIDDALRAYGIVN